MTLLPTLLTFTPTLATETLHLTLENPISTDASIVIINNSGKIVDNEKLDQGINSKVIDISKYVTGIYFVSLTSNGISETTKLIVE